MFSTCALIASSCATGVNMTIGHGGLMCIENVCVCVCACGSCLLEWTVGPQLVLGDTVKRSWPAVVWTEVNCGKVIGTTTSQVQCVFASLRCSRLEPHPTRPTCTVCVKSCAKKWLCTCGSNLSHFFVSGAEPCGHVDKKLTWWLHLCYPGIAFPRGKRIDPVCFFTIQVDSGADSPTETSQGENRDFTNSVMNL